MLNKNKPKITIITVTYNAAENGLEKTIQNILDQDYPNIEYIIKDGGSTDRTIDIIKKYEKHLTKFVIKKDSGIYDAMNQGVKLASGDFINFMNAGDTFTYPNTISNFVKKIDKKHQIYFGSANLLTDEGVKLAEGVLRLQYGMTICHQALFVARSLLKRYPFNLSYKIASDYDFLYKCFKKGIKFKKLNQIVCNYDTHGASGYDPNTVNHWATMIEFLQIYGHYEGPEKLVKGEMMQIFIKEYLKYNPINMEDTENIVRQMKNISVFRNPLKKYKLYKKLVSRVI